MKFCTKLPNFVHIGNMMSDRFFKMASAAAEYYFRFRICWCHCLQNIKIYQQTKFRRHISIHGWDITTFVFEKQTSAILEFYFRFRSRPFRRNLHAILHQATEFRPNRSTNCGKKYDLISISQDGGRSILLPVSYLLMSLLFRRWKSQQTKFRQHISINGSINYFRFWKTNVRHSGILLPVSISTILP